jgi:DNA-binding response OmpR family regulator
MKATILAVDDDPIILEMYRLILEGDHDLHLLSSGAAALEYLKARPRVDLILLDIMMPDVDGYQICHSIRDDSLFSNVKIILVSSKMTLEDRLRGYEIGADDYITKPFEPSELLAKTKVFLRLKNVEEINKIKTNFINLLNHEARTPLTSIFGYTRLLRESPNLTQEEKALLTEIEKSGQKLLKSCEKTLLLSDLKSGNISIEKVRMPLNLFFSDYRVAVENKESKGSVLRFSGNADLWIDADPKLFSVAINGVLENGLKYAAEGTVVDVSTKVVSGDRLRIEVANEGEKIPPERQEDIFNELSVHDMEHHYEGYGLSLAISRRIIEAHGGSLTFENHSAGPVFLIDIAAHDGQASP